MRFKKPNANIFILHYQDKIDKSRPMIRIYQGWYLKVSTSKSLSNVMIKRFDNQSRDGSMVIKFDTFRYLSVFHSKRKF